MPLLFHVDKRWGLSKPLVAALLLAGAALLSRSAVNAQTAKSTRGTDHQVQLATRLDIESHDMREHLKKMRAHAIRYHLSEVPSESKLLQQEWYQLLVTGRRIHQRMVEAAMADLREDPKLDSGPAEFLIRVSARNADADRFEGMLEVVQLLKELGHSSPQFDLCYALTAASQNEYEAAFPHIKPAVENVEKGLREVGESKDITEEQRQTLGKKIFETYKLLGELGEAERNKSIWEAELKAREADSAGEPLPRVLIETSKGTIEVELFENQAPNTVANFISLCESGFYDKLSFHRVITHFMAQSGCPIGDGLGGPDYAIRTELDGKTDRGFFRGTLGMAMSGAPDSGGSQFFICYLPRAYLNGKYVAFGRVVEGMNVLSDLAHINPEDKDSEIKTQDLPDQILSTSVLRKRAHDYTPQKLPKAH